MFFIGDLHGRFKTHKWLIEDMVLPETDYRGFNHRMDCSLQIGDFGLFWKKDIPNTLVAAEHKFFRGNHDNPVLCHQHPNYLGDGGFVPEMDMFWVAGAYSIDWDSRLDKLKEKCKEEGIKLPWLGQCISEEATIKLFLEHRDELNELDISTWWPDEQLSMDKLTELVELYCDSKPKIMVSHDAPTVIRQLKSLTDKPRSRTEAALQTMWRWHKPEIWIFGHFHKRLDYQSEYTGNTRFVGLNGFGCGDPSPKSCLFEIPGLNWPD